MQRLKHEVRRGSVRVTRHPPRVPRRSRNSRRPSPQPRHPSNDPPSPTLAPPEPREPIQVEGSGTGKYGYIVMVTDFTYVSEGMVTDRAPRGPSSARSLTHFRLSRDRCSTRW